MERPTSTIIGSMILAILLQVSAIQASNQLTHLPDYSRLLDYIQMQDLEDPLIVFGEAENKFDQQLNQENVAYLNENKELLQHIQMRLNVNSIQWQLNTHFKQLLVVPENRDDYARLFEQYCRDAIDYLLARIRLPNPYGDIATVKEPMPAVRGKGHKGINVYLVHNIADEYIEEYLFYSKDNDQTKIKIKLSNRAFDGKIGSYSSKLKIGKNSTFEFTRESYTLWQNSAKDPLNVFIVPIEETLHILLRDTTEAAIQGTLAQCKPKDIHDLESVISDWMAVEEAIVGGVVWQIMPDLLTHFVDELAEAKMSETMAARDEHIQYRLLDQGIRQVADLGVEAAIALYQSAPQRFRRMLDPPVQSAQVGHPSLGPAPN